MTYKGVCQGPGNIDNISANSNKVGREMIQGKGNLRGNLEKGLRGRNDPWYTGIKSPKNKHNFKCHYVYTMVGNTM